MKDESNKNMPKEQEEAITEKRKTNKKANEHS